jgi:hypothetical protein
MDDQTLVSDGLDPDAGSGRVLLLACGALAHEIVALKAANGWDHLELACLPAILHNHPDRITDAVRKAVETHRDRFDDIFVAYADCGTGGQLERACADMGVEMIAGPHCYAFFEGLDRFAAHEEEITAFYLTDFLARQFDAFVWRPLGLDRSPELRDIYFGNYTKLVYLAQTDDPRLTDLARTHAERLGLAFERRVTGYGDLEATLRGWVR